MALSPEQRAIRNAIVHIGRRRGASPKEIKAALETGLVESNLHNLPGGDADSQGWRQERASIYKNPRNLTASINRFYDETARARDQYGSAGQLAAAVQRPRKEYRGRYQQRSAQADQLLGRSVGDGSGGMARAASVSTSRKLTNPAVDNSASRMSLAQSFLSKSGNNPLSFVQGLRDRADVPAQYATTRTVQPASSGRSSASSAGPSVAGGKVIIAKGADRPGIGVGKEARGFFATVAGHARAPVTVTTGTNHNRMTVDGNVSDHWDGHAGDFAVPVDSQKGDLLAAHALVAAGVPWQKAYQMARAGGLYSITPSRGQYKGRRIQVIWKTMKGGNHHNHVHIGIR